ncbi:MAG: PrsW family intramembrane metalloprotease [Leptolyngbyaceae cyanobacterium RM2_2_4]|nr:PrsW family intramembrane metalloprotease [Leptolyngbyaceae cyanobacterium SM1_4_3]NJN92390.1 PrsW family intramembrane metalloprotease [Leptolyngbyaceae cyanobacterium SL_5_14]NJO50582.1 PrsW family intramembrane metalloprotease [Leptolyngbyaceae cyanobacterium RM2_2_4]
MIQSSLVELAQQGDPGAIAALLNQALQPRGVMAKVLLMDGCLQILLSSNRPLAQQTFISFLNRQISSYRAKPIQLVKVYGQVIGEDVPAWYEEFVPTFDDSVEPEPIELAKPRSETNDFLATLRTFQFSAVFPYRDVLSLGLYQNHLVKILLFFGLFPLVVDLITPDKASVQQTAWMLGIYYASIWGVVLYNLIKPPQFSWRDTLKCVLFTAFVGIPMLLFFQQVPPFNAFYAVIGAGMVPRMIGFVLGVGVLEELCKALPIYLFLLRPGKLQDPLTSAFYGATSGLGFAMAEGATYSLLYRFSLTRGDLDFGSYVLANTIRFVSLPLFHAILAGMVGYFMGLAAINPSRRSAIIFIGVAIAALLHGLYNTFAGNFLGLLIIGFSILLFVTYIRRSKQMVEEMQKAEMGYQGIKIER